MAFIDDPSKWSQGLEELSSLHIQLKAIYPDVAAPNVKVALRVSAAAISSVWQLVQTITTGLFITVLVSTSSGSLLQKKAKSLSEVES